MPGDSNRTNPRLKVHYPFDIKTKNLGRELYNGVHVQIIFRIYLTEIDHSWLKF